MPYLLIHHDLDALCQFLTRGKNCPRIDGVAGGWLACGRGTAAQRYASSGDHHCQDGSAQARNRRATPIKTWEGLVLAPRLCDCAGLAATGVARARIASMSPRCLGGRRRQQ